MLKSTKRSICSLLSLFIVGPVFTTSVWAQSEIDSVKANLGQIIPSSMEILSVDLTAMENVYEVIAGTETLYVYSRDKFVMIGEVFDTERRTSWAQEKRDKTRQEALVELAEVPETNMIIMGDKGGDRYVTVFTDTDCGWCQKFHKDIPALARGGLKVRYMMWPRSGLSSDSYREAVSVWCSADQGKAMTIAKNRKEIERIECENPVADQYALGHRLGVQGTPFVMLDDGTVLGGYVPPERLLAEAGLN